MNEKQVSTPPGGGTPPSTATCRRCGAALRWRSGRRKDGKPFRVAWNAVAGGGVHFAHCRAAAEPRP